MRAVVFASVLLLAAATVSAHPAPFSYLDLRLADDGVSGALIVHDFDVAHDVGVDPPELLKDPAVAEKYRDVLTRLMDSRAHAPARWHAGDAGVGRHRDASRSPERPPDLSRRRPTRPASVRVNAIVFPYDPVHQTFVNVYENDDAAPPGDPRLRSGAPAITTPAAGRERPPCSASSSRPASSTS